MQFRDTFETRFRAEKRAESAAADLLEAFWMGPPGLEPGTDGLRALARTAFLSVLSLSSLLLGFAKAAWIPTVRDTLRAQRQVIVATVTEPWRRGPDVCFATEPFASDPQPTNPDTNPLYATL